MRHNEATEQKLQLDRIERKVNEILTLMGESPLNTGVIIAQNGDMFSPGTGQLGGSGVHRPDPNKGRSESPEERARIVAEAKASIAAARHREVPQSEGTRHE